MSPAHSWYPGHMVATQKTIRELAPYLTVFIEVVDARAPELTRHRPLAGWVGKTPRMVVLNKADVADPEVTRLWLDWYRRQTGVPALALTAAAVGADKVLKGALVRSFPGPYRLAVVGMPNIGKSTLLNRMVGRHRVATGAKPGITRGPQWIRMGDGWEWLDLPGVVTPAKSQDWRLKLLGVVPAVAAEMDELAEAAWREIHPRDESEAWLGWGRERGYLTRGGGVDRQRTAEAIVKLFREGGFGPVSLERPEGGGG